MKMKKLILDQAKNRAFYVISQRLFSLIVLSALCASVNAQQIPQYSQYMKNPYLINPGAAGQFNFIDVTAGARLQWLGFADAPKTMYFSATSVLGPKRSKYNPSVKVDYGAVRNPEAIYNAQKKHAMGGSLVVDQYGAFQYIKATATYAFHLPVTSKMFLSGFLLAYSKAVMIPAGPAPIIQRS